MTLKLETTSTNILDTAKAFSTMAARCALVGAALTVENDINGRLRYVVELRGRVHFFDKIEQIEILVDVIGGAK